MIAEFGLLALWLAAALAALQLLAGAFALKDGEAGATLGTLVRPAAVLQGGLTLLAFVMLLWLFARTDLSVLLVASNSHTAKPLLYKITGAWGNHEGSMLLWVTIMALSGALIAAIERRLPERTMLATLAAQGFVGLGFYAFLLFSSNPFERLSPAAQEGLGLNPLLQDVGLAMHPPTLYVGYVGLSVAFSFAVGALITRQVTPDFASVMRPWVLGAWIFLTLGLTAGSYWAYYELGWGGWWFWDPVENAALMPWLAATALLHSVSVLASRDALRTWTIMLGVIAFSMSMVGTFLVRSGILTSVHSFAVDPERGSFILALLIIYIGGALLLFALRANAVAEGKRFAAVSREGALVVNNVLLTGILAIVLLGTLYPLMAEVLGARISVGPPYFNPVGAVFFLPLVAVMAVGPLLRWRGDAIGRVQGKAILWLAVVVVALALFGFSTDIGFLPLLGMALGLGLAVASLLPLAGRNLLRAPLATWGMVVAHFGLAVAMVGAASDAAFTQERLKAMAIGDTTQIGPWQITLSDVAPVAGPNWTALEAQITASYAKAEPVFLESQARTYWSPQQETSEVSIHTRWNGQLYAVVGKEAEGDRWQMRLWWKPFVTLIWLGGILVALGGTVALVGRVLADLKRRYIQRRIAERQESAA